jgi:hypothetical protein
MAFTIDANGIYRYDGVIIGDAAEAIDANAGTISTAISNLIPKSDINAANGIAGLNSSGNLVAPIEIYTDTYADLASLVPLLGQQMYSTDTHVLAVGDGTTTFTELPYSLSSYGGSYQLQNTLSFHNSSGDYPDGIFSVDPTNCILQFGDFNGDVSNTFITINGNTETVQIAGNDYVTVGGATVNITGYTSVVLDSTVNIQGSLTLTNSSFLSPITIALATGYSDCTLTLPAVTGTLLASVGDIGFFGTSPTSQQLVTTDLITSLTNYGLLTGSGATPLNLNGGTLTANSAILSTTSTINGSDILTAVLINADNGVAGLNSSGNLVAPIEIYTDTASNLSTLVPLLGQQMYATDTFQLAVGDGSTAFADLPLIQLSTVGYLPLTGGTLSNSGNSSLSFGTTGQIYEDAGSFSVVAHDGGLYWDDGGNLLLEIIGSLNLNVGEIGFFNSSAVEQQLVTTDLITSLTNYGLLTGSGATPLDLNGGTLAAGDITLYSAATYSPQTIMHNDANDASGPYWLSLKTRAGGATQSGDALGNFVWQGKDSGGNTDNAALIEVTAGTIGSSYIDTTISFQTTVGGTTAERLLIDSSGNVDIAGYVGIGTTSPSYIIDTPTDAYITAHLGTVLVGSWPAGGTDFAFFGHENLDQTVQTNYALLQDGGTGDTYLNASAGAGIHFRIDNVDVATIDTNGNVGIGTASPSHPLDIAYAVSDGVGIRLANSISDSYSQMAFLGTGEQFQIGVGNDSAPSVADKFFIYDATATEFRMVIDTSGNVGIGTTSPGALLDVNGTVNFRGVMFPQQAATVSAPSYVAGGVYYDTTLNKLRIGGASGWETVTSV